LFDEPSCEVELALMIVNYQELAGAHDAATAVACVFGGLLTSINAPMTVSLPNRRQASGRSTAMSMPIKVVVLIAALFASLPSRAQGLFLGFESNIALKRSDINLIHRTVDQNVHGKPVGTTAYWSNPNTGNWGTIKLQKRYTEGGQRCEEVKYTLMAIGVSPEHYVLDSCLQPDGTWKIA
jgi:surface antigen